MRQAWRWYGPDDPVTLDHVRQAGATEIVSALHQYAPGEVWPQKAVAERKAHDREHAARPRAAASGPSSRASRCRTISSAAATALRAQTEIWIESMRAVAAEGIRTICYNVMPVVDWTRTDLDYPMPTGATALRFDYDRFAAFDLHVLKRKGAEADYDEATRARAKKVADGAVAGRCRAADQEHLGRTARRDDVLGQSRCVPRAHRLLRRHHAGQDARQRRGVSREGHAGRRTARRAADAASGRSAAPDLRPAAHRLDRAPTTRRCSRRCRRRRTASASASAVSARGRTTMWCRWRRTSRRASISRICARPRSTTRARASASPSPIISTAT